MTSRSGVSLYQQIFSWPYHTASHQSFRLFPPTGASQLIRFNYDDAELQTRIPFLTCASWASEAYLRDFFFRDSADTSTIPVYRVRVHDTAVVWSASLNGVGAVQPTFMHATGLTAIAYLTYLTWRQFSRVQLEEHMTASTRFSQIATIRRRLEPDISQAPHIYACMANIYRPMCVRHGDDMLPAQIQTFPSGPVADGAKFSGPRMTHYQVLQYIHKAEGAELQDLAVEAASNLAYRMALMSRLVAYRVPFLESEMVIAADMNEAFAMASRLAPGLVHTAVNGSSEETEG